MVNPLLLRFGCLRVRGGDRRRGGRWNYEEARVPFLKVQETKGELKECLPYYDHVFNLIIDH